jgi:hypothetical protein
VFVPHTVIYFVTYEKCKAWDIDRRREREYARSLDEAPSLPLISYMLYSAIACALAASASNPLDVVKTRWQVAYDRRETGKRSPTEIVRNMYLHEGGLRAFTRGMAARIAWMVPASATAMSVFEVLKARRRDRSR